MVFWLFALILATAVHAAGRLLVARVLRLPVVVSLGFAGRFASGRRGDVEYQLGHVPVGLFVQVSPQPPAPANAGEQRLGGMPSVWRQLLLVPAGSLFVFGFAFVLIFAAGWCLAPSELPAPVIGIVYPGQPGAQAGLRPGDRIVAVAGSPTRFWSELQSEISGRAGQRCTLTLQRAGRSLTLEVTPRPLVVDGQNVGRIGISPRFRTSLIGISRSGSPAARAGLQTGDLITAVDGAAVAHWSELQERLAAHGTAALRIAYLRPTRAPLSWEELRKSAGRETTLEPLSGAVSAEALGLELGEFFVRAVESGSPASEAGLRPGDRVTALDGREIAYWELTLGELLAQPEKQHSLTWVSPGGAPRTAAVTLAVKGRDLVLGAELWILHREAPEEPLENPAGYAATSAAGSMMMMLRGWVAMLRGTPPRTAVLAVGLRPEDRPAWSWIVVFVLGQLSLLVSIVSLLPLPGLPGSELVFLGIEAARRRPLSPRVRSLASAIGASLMILFALVAVLGFLSRVVGQ